MTYQPTIRTQHDLEEAWRFLMHPLGFSGRSTWFMLIDADGRPVPQITQIEEADRPPAPGEIAGLADVVKELRDEFVPGGRLASCSAGPALRPSPPTTWGGLEPCTRCAGSPTYPSRWCTSPATPTSFRSRWTRRCLTAPRDGAPDG